MKYILTANNEDLPVGVNEQSSQSVEILIHQVMKGDTGATGPTGPQGPKGDKGDAGTLDNVTASVDANVGTPSVVVTYDGANANFAFHNLKGVQGATGPQGATGEQGEKGDTGEKGDKGDNGEKGDKGDKGDTGSQGPKGDTGNDGVSPTVSTSKSGKTTTITIVDAQGTHTATVLDGDDASVTKQAVESVLTGNITSHTHNQYAQSEDLAEVATSGDYEDLENKPTIPTKTSDLENDGDGDNPFLTYHQSLSAYRTSANQDVIDNALDQRLDTIEGKESGWDNKISNPATEGTNGQVLTTDGNGGRTWTSKTQVVNDTTHTDTDKALSANMGKELQTEINNLKNIGRFLAIWDASTGLPTSNPTTSPYTYKVGDYYRIGVTGTRNPAPNTTYVIGGTNYVIGDTLESGDVVYCSNVTASSTTWVRQQSSGGGTVQDVTLNGVSLLNSGVANIPLASTSENGAMSSSDKSKLNGIEAGADVTDATNVESAGAVMTTAQTLTDNQKSQARTNIGASAPMTIEILEGGDV